MARLLEQYRETLVPQLMEQFGYANRLAVPRIEKVCLNMGLGQAMENPKVLDQAWQTAKRQIASHEFRPPADQLAELDTVYQKALKAVA